MKTLFMKTIELERNSSMMKTEPNLKYFSDSILLLATASYDAIMLLLLSYMLLE